MIGFDGPRGRYYRAVYELKNPEVSPVSDVWVDKLKRMIRQRDEYDANKYADEQPLFYTLFSIFENDSVNSPKQMLEAMLTTGEDFRVICEKLGDPDIQESLLVAAYHELFYNIRPYLKSVPLMYRYVVQPLTVCNGNEIPVGGIWKLLAYCGGMDILIASGFGTRPLNAEDLKYLAQLGGYRNAALMLKYISLGEEFAKENPIAMNIVAGLAELGGKSEETDRDKFGFKQQIKAESTYSDALTGMFRMVYDKDAPPPTSEVDVEDKLITCKPVKYEDQ